MAWQGPYYMHKIPHCCIPWTSFLGIQDIFLTQKENGFLAGSILYAQNSSLLHPLDLFFGHSWHCLGISLHFLQQFEGHGLGPGALRSRFPRRSGIVTIVTVVTVSWSGLWLAIDDDRTANNTRRPRR